MNTTITANNAVFKNLLTLPMRAHSNGFSFNSFVPLNSLTTLLTIFANKITATANNPQTADHNDTQFVVS